MEREVRCPSAPGRCGDVASADVADVALLSLRLPQGGSEGHHRAPRGHVELHLGAFTWVSLGSLCVFTKLTVSTRAGPCDSEPRAARSALGAVRTTEA